MRSTKFNTPV